MAHLIDHDRGQLVEVAARLEVAHAALVDRASTLVGELAQLPIDTWGVSAKRVGNGGQPLGELINQLATVERLLDALEWVSVQRGEHAEVAVNPTTSSLGNDLVVDGDAAEPPWLFEVSDVASSGNNNRKLDRDVESLPESLPGQPEVRRFLVVSAEWTSWLSAASDQLWRRRGVRPPTELRVHADVGRRGTGVIELVPAVIHRDVGEVGRRMEMSAPWSET